MKVEAGSKRFSDNMQQEIPPCFGYQKLSNDAKHTSIAIYSQGSKSTCRSHILDPATISVIVKMVYGSSEQCPFVGLISSQHFQNLTSSHSQSSNMTRRRHC